MTTFLLRIAGMQDVAGGRLGDLGFHQPGREEDALSLHPATGLLQHLDSRRIAEVDADGFQQTQAGFMDAPDLLLREILKVLHAHTSAFGHLWPFEAVSHGAEKAIGQSIAELVS
jgi:hypothetical protein